VKSEEAGSWEARRLGRGEESFLALDVTLLVY